jgi:hypothetical protein
MNEPSTRTAATGQLMQCFIHHVRVERPPASESAAQARERLREKFPRNSLRRMTHLGMLLGATLEDVVVRPDDALVYASSFAETRALEDFLISFPAASPLLFQTSIHPGGVQQVLIGRQQPVARLWPLAGRARLVEHALLTAMLESAPRVIVIGGEERGTWLLEHGMASDRAFGFALLLTRDSSGAAGVVSLGSDSQSQPASREIPASTPPEPGTDAEACPTLARFADTLAGRQPLAWRGGAGPWRLVWS